MGKACISKPQQASCLYLLKIPAMNYVLMDPPVGRERRKGVFVHLWCRNKTEEEFTDENVLFKHLVESAWLLLLNPEREGREVFWCSCVLVSLCAAEKPSGHKHLICKAPLSSWALKKEIFITWSDSMVLTVGFILWSVTLRHSWVALPGIYVQQHKCVCVCLSQKSFGRSVMGCGQECCVQQGLLPQYLVLTQETLYCEAVWQKKWKYVAISMLCCHWKLVDFFFFKYQGSGDLELLWNRCGMILAELEQILAFI